MTRVTSWAAWYKIFFSSSLVLVFRLAAFLPLCLLPQPCLALAGDWVRDDAAAVRLVSALDATGQESTIPAGLEIDLAEGWHTYWRSPGEAGLPPQLDWSRNQNDTGNVKIAALFYPAPSRYTAYGLETVGYKGHVLFPLDIKPAHPGQAVVLTPSVDLLVCNALCVPKHFEPSLTLPAGTAPPGAESALIARARAAVPGDAATAGFALPHAATDARGLTFTFSSRDGFSKPDLFVENDKNIGFGPPQTELSPDGHTAQMTVTPTDKVPDGMTLADLPVTLTLVDGDRAAEIRAPGQGGLATIQSSVIQAASVHPAATPAPSFAVAAFLALLGGLILNLMPCVLPVLSLKMLSVGVAMGWGVQFQQPLFLMFLTVVLTFFAANLWDLFDIPLPRFLADRMTRAYHPKLAGDFATGALATLLATPCSAPFLGTAVGFALASGPTEIVFLFAALGCGMALPYLAVAAYPRLATCLPRPGAWMIRLRHALGLALALTALWLIWVMAAQITVFYATAFGLFMIGIVVLLALGKRGVRRRLVLIGLAECLLFGLAMGLTGMTHPKGAPVIDRAWVPYSDSALTEARAQGKTVFLDVTADWCLTCKANWKLTLSRPGIRARLSGANVVAMQADWTNPDPEIADLLHRYGRYGIPFNIVFGPRAPDGVLLPELLTPGAVTQALDAASPL